VVRFPEEGEELALQCVPPGLTSHRAAVTGRPDERPFRSGRYQVPGPKTGIAGACW